MRQKYVMFSLNDGRLVPVLVPDLPEFKHLHLVDVIHPADGTIRSAGFAFIEPHGSSYAVMVSGESESLKQAGFKSYKNNGNVDRDAIIASLNPAGNQFDLHTPSPLPKEWTDLK